MKLVQTMEINEITKHSIQFIFFADFLYKEIDKFSTKASLLQAKFKTLDKSKLK
jgi:hypothetical protein